MKTLISFCLKVVNFALVILIVFSIFTEKTLFPQSETNFEEIIFYTTNIDNLITAVYDSVIDDTVYYYPRLLMKNISSVWIFTANPDSFCPIDRFKQSTHFLYTGVDTFKYSFYGGSYATGSDTFGFAQYKFCIQKYLIGYNDYNTVDSIIIDYTDSMYCGWTSPPYYFPSVDISIKYDYNDTNKFYYWIPLQYDYGGTWWKVKDSLSDFSWGIWESNRNKSSSYQYPRTKSFIPEPPADFNLTSSSGSPYLSWNSNGEPFNVEYKIYRKLNNKYGAYTNIANTTNTYYLDEEISCAGGGRWVAYYYVVTRNNSNGSSKVSTTTDTLDILYDCVTKKTSGTDNKNSDCEVIQNYPNPFNPNTSIKFNTIRPGRIRLSVFDMLGREIRTLINEVLQPGEHNVIWDGCDKRGKHVSSGIYIYRLKTGETIKTRKMILLR